MEVIMGGPGSTGSSLLCRILNRHSGIVCGPETRLLSLPQLYKDWQKNKSRITQKAPFGLRAGAFHNITGIDLGWYKQLWPNEDFLQLIRSSDTFSVFIKQFSKKILHDSNARIWVEKTPNNIYCISSFLETFEDSKAIITLRDPLEIIASQMARGKSCFNAVSHCLIHYALALEIMDDDRIYPFYYESLIANPLKEVEQLLSFLNMDLEPNMLGNHFSSTSTDENTQLKGWRYDETKMVAQKVQSRFEQLPQEIIDKIFFFIEHISLRESNLGYSINDFEALYNKIKYDLPPHSRSSKSFNAVLKQEMRADKIFRLKKLQLHFLKHYPIQIKE